MPITPENCRPSGRFNESGANKNKLGIYLPTNKPQVAIDQRSKFFLSLF